MDNAIEELSAHEIDLATAYEREREAEVQREKARQYEGVLAQKRAANEQKAREDKIKEATTAINKLAAEFRAARVERDRLIREVTLQASAAKLAIRQAAALEQKLADGAQALAHMQLIGQNVSPPEMAFLINTTTDEILISVDAKNDPMSPAKVAAIMEL